MLLWLMNMGFSGGGGDQPPVAPDIPPSAGNIDWLRKRKKSRKIIRFSDYASQEEFATALAEASLPIARIEEPHAFEDEFGEDDEIIKALFLIQTIN